MEMGELGAWRKHPAWKWALDRAISIACTCVKDHDRMVDDSELQKPQYALENLIAVALCEAFDRGAGQRVPEVDAGLSAP